MYKTRGNSYRIEKDPAKKKEFIISPVELFNYYTNNCTYIEFIKFTH